MGEQKAHKLRWLSQQLPEGVVVDAAWLTKNGFPANLRNKYVAAGWLDHPAPRVFRRRQGPISWQQVVISLQTLLELDVIVGGRTALDLHGHSHYLEQATTAVYLYGPSRLPTWLKALVPDVKFFHRDDRKIFNREIASTDPHSLIPRATQPRSNSIATLPWGQWEWPLLMSTPERAILELMYELPSRDSFHNADVLMQGLSSLSPRRLQTLLEDCISVKVKRLFFFFADRHQHAWLRRLDRKRIDLGRGSRKIVRQGQYDRVHKITVPRNDAFQ
jgi:hypothetical protein